MGGAVMEHAITVGTARRIYSDIDLGGLRDLGYTGVATPPLVDFSTADYAVSEGGGSVTITVNLSAAPGTANMAQVDFATSNGSATSPGDYTATIGTLVFGAAETSKTFTVSIIDDGDTESYETITLTLSNPVNCWIAGTNNPATITISDNDAAVWVDFGAGGGGTGTEGDPFNLLSSAVDAVDSGGIIKIKSDVATTTSAESNFSITKAMRIESSPAGTVRIGVAAGKRGTAHSGDDAQDSDDAATRFESWLSASALPQTALPLARPVNLAEPETDAAGAAVTVYESVLPRGADAEGTHVALPGAPLFLRLRSGDAIDTASLWAEIPEGVPRQAEWLSAGAGNDLWIRVAPGLETDDGSVTLRTGGATYTGAALAPNAARFRARENGSAADEVWQPVIGIDLALESADAAYIEGAGLVRAPEPPPPRAVTPVYSVTPESAYETPHWVWVEVPAGIPAAALMLHYRHDGAWLPAAYVAGWLHPGSYHRAEIGARSYLGFQVRHAGTFAVTEM